MRFLSRRPLIQIKPINSRQRQRSAHETRARGASICKTVKATKTSRQIVKYFLADLRPLKSRKAEEAVADRIRIIKHEGVPPECGSYEVRFSDGRPSKYFYWEDIPDRRLRSEQADKALEEAEAFTWAERDHVRVTTSSSRLRRSIEAATSAPCAEGIDLIAEQRRRRRLI
jgi:hypothetical protein